MVDDDDDDDDQDMIAEFLALTLLNILDLIPSDQNGVLSLTAQGSRYLISGGSQDCKHFLGVFGVGAGHMSSAPKETPMEITMSIRPLAVFYKC